MFENPDLKALGSNDLEDFGHLSEIEATNKNRGWLRPPYLYIMNAGMESLPSWMNSRYKRPHIFHHWNPYPPTSEFGWDSDDLFCFLFSHPVAHFEFDMFN